MRSNSSFVAFILASFAITTLLTGCEKINPGWCGLTPEGCADAGPTDATVDTPTDGAVDALPLVASIATCGRIIPEDTPPENRGITNDRPIAIRCTAVARQCAGTATAVAGLGSFLPISFALVPSGQADQWVGTFVPGLGVNALRFTCQGSEGTEPAQWDLPEPLSAMRFHITGIEVQCPTPGHCSVPSRASRITLDGEMPGASSGCAGSVIPANSGFGFAGTLDCPVWTHGPYPVNDFPGPARTVLYTVTGPGGYEGIIALDVPAS